MPSKLDDVCAQYEKELADQALRKQMEEIFGKRDPNAKIAAELQNGRCNEPYKCLAAELRLSNF
jgi:hypothetical protein